MTKKLPSQSKRPSPTDRATEAVEILDAIQDLIIPRIRSADEDAATKISGHGLAVPGGAPRTVLVEQHTPQKLLSLLNLDTPDAGSGQNGLVDAARTVLQYSVNTWDRGFLDKLYSSPDPPGLAADLLLSTLNTNLHVYSVAPALSLVEKHTGTALARLFGFQGPHAGGVTVPGGSASNYTGMLVARNFMFPHTKANGNSALDKPLAIFTSDVAHYSVSAAALQLGLGTAAVYKVRTLQSGAMDVAALPESIREARSDGRQPFFVCATSGTTVRGAYDALGKIAAVCKQEKVWMHVDACWGGGVIFSEMHRGKMDGSGLADTISFNPHKMLGVPVTTSFIMGADMRKFHKANSLDAGYLFHGSKSKKAPQPEGGSASDHSRRNGDADGILADVPSWDQIHDLAMLVPQCGRRGDALKLYLAWQYHGTSGFAAGVDAAFAAAQRLFCQLEKTVGVQMVGEGRPECCQVCFRYTGKPSSGGLQADAARNSKLTRAVVAGLVRRGWMIDYTSSAEGDYLRVVCNRGTSDEIVDGLLKAMVGAGEEAVQQID